MGAQTAQTAAAFSQTAANWERPTHRRISVFTNGVHKRCSKRPKTPPIGPLGGSVCAVCANGGGAKRKLRRRGASVDESCPPLAATVGVKPSRGERRTARVSSPRGLCLQQCAMLSRSPAQKLSSREKRRACGVHAASCRAISPPATAAPRDGLTAARRRRSRRPGGSRRRHRRS